MTIPSQYIKDEKLVDADKTRWCAKHLPASHTGFIFQDIDGVVRDFKGNVLLLEIKRMMAETSTCQDVTLFLLHMALNRMKGKKVNMKKFRIPAEFTLKYHGLFILQIDGIHIETDDKYLNGLKVTNQELADYLSFKKKFPWHKLSAS